MFRLFMSLWLITASAVNVWADDFWAKQAEKTKATKGVHVAKRYAHPRRFDRAFWGHIRYLDAAADSYTTLCATKGGDGQLSCAPDGGGVLLVSGTLRFEFKGRKLISYREISGDSEIYVARVDDTIVSRVTKGKEYITVFSPFVPPHTDKSGRCESVDECFKLQSYDHYVDVYAEPVVTISGGLYRNMDGGRLGSKLDKTFIGCQAEEISESKLDFVSAVLGLPTSPDASVPADVSLFSRLKPQAFTGCLAGGLK